MSENKIKDIIDLYYSKKKNNNNDYVLVLDEEVEVKIINPNNGEVTISKTKEVPTRTDLLIKTGSVVSKDRIEELSPDNIDNKDFWKYAVEKFPNYSISGYPKCKSEEDVNKANLNVAVWNGVLKKITQQIKSKPNSKVLEIGPGYGNIFNHIMSNYQECNYLAIDINPLFHYDGLFECDGSTIPKELGNNFNLIFSNNAFCHMSTSQRSSYYKECFEKLIKGGKFIFQNLLLVEENKNLEGLWSYKDEKGNPYTTFFSQLIPVDSYEELADELNDIGFSIKVSVKQNGAVIECEK